MTAPTLHLLNTQTQEGSVRRVRGNCAGAVRPTGDPCGLPPEDSVTTGDSIDIYLWFC